MSPSADIIKIPKHYKRDYAVDNLKGFLIILVILGHGNLLPSFKTTLADFLQGYIYLFHMPLFFGISTLFIKEFSWTYFKARFIQLMIPFFFFIVIDPINVFFQVIHPGYSTLPLFFDFHLKEVIKRVFIGSGVYIQSPLWFLPALFLANMFVSLFIKYRHKPLCIGAFCLAFCGVLLYVHLIREYNFMVPYGVFIVIYVSPILVLLRYLYMNKNRLLTYNPFLFVMGICFSSVLIIYLIPKTPPMALTGRFDLAQFRVPGNILGYLLICALSAFIFLLFLNFNKRSVFSKIGYYTLPIFLLHFYPWFTWLHFSPALYLPVNVIGNILIAIGISKLLMKISPKFSWIGMIV
ncbi:acyltransferase family protein [Mucilaginibacter sp.]|uniref:acyltransferase family protein n=1 Tax=Mucilaginibacter sp. TaxID=1882438 RepID=UPI002840028B|nr:acyltransferase family protein [Mucilaginibacter sp.]MDR3695449.1 acyltransferase family protein [Mucilaginibacter sp.]